MHVNEYERLFNVTTNYSQIRLKNNTFIVVLHFTVTARSSRMSLALANV
jgi:preprotein translocase subunit SecB